MILNLAMLKIFEVREMAPHTLMRCILSVNRDAGQADLPIIKV